jgi:hypothetical protein
VQRSPDRGPSHVSVFSVTFPLGRYDSAAKIVALGKELLPNVGGVWDAEPPSSLSPQRLNGIDASCATRGDIRSEPADE